MVVLGLQFLTGPEGRRDSSSGSAGVSLWT